MMESSGYYAVDVGFPLVKTFIDRSRGSVKRCDLTRINAVYNEMKDKMLFRTKKRCVGKD